MNAKSRKRERFHVSPRRLHVPWMIFVPLGVIFLIISCFVPPEQSGEKEALWLLTGLFFVIAALISLLIRRTRLEISEKGIRLRQPGYTLETAWENVSKLISDRGAESFVTREAMTGKGCQRLAAAAEIGRGLLAFYDQERLGLIFEYRLIPIEAFAWHLHTSGKLRRSLLKFAPQLVADIDDAAN